MAAVRTPQAVRQVVLSDLQALPICPGPVGTYIPGKPGQATYRTWTLHMCSQAQVLQPYMQCSGGLPSTVEFAVCPVCVGTLVS